MKRIERDDAGYRSLPKDLSLLARTAPSLHFYSRLFGIVVRASNKVKRGVYDEGAWGEDSRAVLGYLEDIGIDIEVIGLQHLRSLKPPYVVIGNHMSFLETMLLPCMILPFSSVTYVVKESLLEYPIFKHVMRSRNPVAVSRTNPRQDLQTVLREGAERLSRGISMIVFPQSTRSHQFQPQQMSSIGVKLAKKAGVPVVPLALKTDALQNGRLFKDFGALRTDLPVHFAFAAPFMVEGKGGEEQERITTFISGQLAQWQRECAVE